MLSKKALQILTILQEQNKKPITAKKIDEKMGVSERSIKTYINEVDDFCAKSNCNFIRKAGVGFILEYTEEGIEKINREKSIYNQNISKEYRISYILYILLIGWTTYSISLFADELNVSKNIICDDLDYIEPRINEFGLRLNRVKGKGLSICGDEITKRRAFKKFCKQPIREYYIENETILDNRLTLQKEVLLRANYGTKSVKMALDLIKEFEDYFDFYYTDYSFRMVLEYLSINIMRIRHQNYIKECFNISNKNSKDFDNIIRNILEFKYGLSVSNDEKNYLYTILKSGDFQNGITESEHIFKSKYDINSICIDIVEYLQNIVDIDFHKIDILYQSLNHFLPASFNRVENDLEIENPFFNDVKSIYPSALSISYSLEIFYKKYISKLPNEQEIRFLALFVASVIKNTKCKIRAILLSNCGYIISNIISERIKEKVKEIEVVAIFSLKEKDDINLFDYDIIICVDYLYSSISNNNGDIVLISSAVTENDIKKIKQAYYEKIKNYNEEDFIISLFPDDLIFFENDFKDSESIINFLCNNMYEKGYINKNYIDEVLKREYICSTFIGNSIAIPHGNNSSILKSGISVLKLNKAVKWGDNEVRIVFLLALNFNNIKLIKEFFKRFTKLVENQEYIYKLLDSNSINNFKYNLLNVLFDKDF